MPSDARVLSESLHAELRRELLGQRLAPGDPVTEASLAARYGVARSTARLAIERLVAEGLLEREAHRSARVPVLDRDDVLDLFTTRAVVEGAAVESLARAGAAPAEAVAAQRALTEAARAGADFAEHDVAFHRALAAGQPSPRLARLHALLLGEIELCIGQVQAGGLLDAATIAGEHEAILAAIVAGDRVAATERTRDHIHHARDVLVAHVDARQLAAPGRSA